MPTSFPPESSIRTFSTGSKRSSDVDDFRFDLISPIGIARLARRCATGAERYGEHNWLKGQPYSSVINHMEAHLNKFKLGDTSDDNLAAIAWGAFALMTYEEILPEMDDRFDYKVNSAPVLAPVAISEEVCHCDDWQGNPGDKCPACGNDTCPDHERTVWCDRCHPHPGSAYESLGVADSF